MKITLRTAFILLIVGMLAFTLVPLGFAEDQPITSNATRVDENTQILIWNAPAIEPGRQSADNVGSLAYINGNGDISNLADVLPQSGRVEPCGPNALSPDGRHLALYQGNVGGVVSSLYLITDGAAPVLVNDQFQPLSCVGGNGVLNFSPDSSYMTFIEYERDFNIGFADGTLRIVNTADLSELFSLDTVVAFEQSPDGVAFVRFFRNDRDEADEVAIIFWDGNIDRELTSFFVEDESCQYRDASITTAPDGLLWLGLVERCNGENTLLVYRINPLDRNTELIFSANAGRAAFANVAQSNNLWFSTDGNTVLYTIPDGFTFETVSLNAYDISQGESRTLIDQQMVVGGVSGQSGNNDFSRVAPDGRYLITLVTNPAGNDNEMRLFDLTDITKEPVVIPAGGSGDIIPYIDFTRDGSRMVYVAGGDENSLFFLDLNAENPSPIRVRRGRFSRFATISPAGNEVAILENFLPDENLRGPERFTNLVSINLDTSEVTPLYQGATVTETDVEDVSFAAPLFWFR